MKDRVSIATLLAVFFCVMFVQIAQAQVRQYHLEQEWAKIWINQDGTTDLFYNISMTLDSGPSINSIYIGQPTGDFTIGAAKDQYNRTLVAADASSGNDYKAKVNLATPLPAGQTIWFTLSTNVAHMIWEDTQNPGNVGMQFIPTWWSEARVLDLRVSIVLPVGVDATMVVTSINWDSDLTEPAGRLSVYWERRDLMPNEQYCFGVSFPKEYLQVYQRSRVHNIDTNLNYASIQEAIDANETLDGHAILVDEGMYNENVIVGKSVSLTGESRERTIINSNQSTQDNFVFLVNRTCGVVVENFTIQNCKVGVFLLNSNNSRISNNRMMNCTWEGVWVYGSYDNFVDRNFFGTSYMGVFIAGEWEESSGNNTIFANIFDGNTEAAIAITSSIHDFVLSNSITQSQIGIDLRHAAHNNSIIANTLKDNMVDISFSGSHNNTFYHNNFITDSRNLSNSQADSIWDNGYPSGGNYWSSYDGLDANGDGIGDTPYILDANNTDHYPLMGMFSKFNVFLPFEKTENVTVISNSTVSNLSLMFWLSSPTDVFQPGQPFIQFFATGENGSVGFCRLMIPRTVLNSSSYIVLVDSQPVNAAELPTSNDTCVYLYFTYPHSVHEVIVTIPEFSWLILPLFMIGTLAVIICKRKRSPNVKQ